MPHMTHNYMLGLAALLISFGITFYLPIAYFWLKVCQQRKQNKQFSLDELLLLIMSADQLIAENEKREHRVNDAPLFPKDHQAVFRAITFLPKSQGIF